MKILKLFLIASILFFSCEEKPIEIPPTQNVFSLKIVATDIDGNSVPNISVSAWNKILLDGMQLPKIRTAKKIQSTSTIQFTLKETSIVSLNICDLENNIIDSTISGIKLAGAYNYNWTHNEPNRGYKILFETKVDSLTDTLTFRDSVYAINYSPDIYISKIGETNESGLFETNNKLLFSSLYGLPDLYRTNSSGPEIVGTITILDTIVIALWNEQTNKAQYFEEPLKNGCNEITLVWNPSLAKVVNKNKTVNRNFKLNIISSIDSIPYLGIPKENMLFQNYPNPFN